MFSEGVGFGKMLYPEVNCKFDKASNVGFSCPREIKAKNASCMTAIIYTPTTLLQSIPSKNIARDKIDTTLERTATTSAN